VRGSAFHTAGLKVAAIRGATNGAIPSVPDFRRGAQTALSAFLVASTARTATSRETKNWETFLCRDSFYTDRAQRRIAA
jgi:hypothetical protein